MRRLVLIGLTCFAGGAACSDSTAYAVRNGADAQGGAAGQGGTSGVAGQGGTSGVAGQGGAAGQGGTAGQGGAAGSSGVDAGTCASNIRITEIDVGGVIVANENEAALMPIALAPIPSGGSRVAWMDDRGMVHVATLDASDRSTTAMLTLPAHDFADLHADDRGGTMLLTRDARGGGNLNCGTLANLCGTNLPSSESCYDMYLVRFDATAETWAAKLTDSSSSLPPYSTGPNGPDVAFVWSAYAHHGRIAFDGSRYAAYFGVALSSSENCTSGGGTNGRGINVFQGDRMKVVGSDGSMQPDGFDFGCSTSGYERIIWDPAARKFVAVCKTGERISLAPPGSGTSTTVSSLDPFYGNLGNLVLAVGGGYWLTASNLQAGQPARAPGLADVHLLHFTTGLADRDFLIASQATLNERAPHLAPFGTTRLLAAWETSTSGGDLGANDRNRKLYVQALNATTGAPDGAEVNVPGILGNRYQDFRGFPDGSVAYAAPGSTNARIKTLRVLPCPM
jgi:hypothetical protein